VGCVSLKNITASELGLCSTTSISVYILARRNRETEKTKGKDEKILRWGRN